MVAGLEETVMVALGGVEVGPDRGLAVLSVVRVAAAGRVV